ncbi:MAG: hypothetical protein ACK47N_10000 [Microcystis sp.]
MPHLLRFLSHNIHKLLHAYISYQLSVISYQLSVIRFFMLTPLIHNS